MVKNLCLVPVGKMFTEMKIGSATDNQ